MIKISIIEDDQALANIYKLKLEKAGMEVMVANTGNSGLAMISDQAFDLLLLDLMLPEMTGSELLAKYRQTASGKDTKVIILTNISEFEAPDELYDLGILRYMVKGDYTPARVVVVVQEALAA